MNGLMNATDKQYKQVTLLNFQSSMVMVMTEEKTGNDIALLKKIH